MNLDLVTLGYAGSALAHALLLPWLLWRGGRSFWREPTAAAFVLAVAATVAWAAAKMLDETIGLPRLPTVTSGFDLLRYAAWFAFVAFMLRPADSAALRSGPWRLAQAAGLGLLLANGLLVLASALVPAWSGPAERLQSASALGLAAFGLMLLEQLFRNQTEAGRWNAKPLCLALACVFAYDLYVFAEAVMFGKLDIDMMQVRGLVHALSVPLLYVAWRRHHGWSTRLQLSRHAAFYSASLLLVGGYLLFIAAVGYYVRYFGGTWGRALQVALLFAAALLLLVLALSGAMRARLRVFLGKHFFSYRYDYRQEWLRFTAMLSTRGSPQEVGVLVVRGLADMVEATTGSLWTRGLDADRYGQTASWNTPPSPEHEPADTAFCAFQREKEWIIDLDEYRSAPRRYEQLVIPRWLLTDTGTRLVVPLIVADELTGFVLLGKPRTALELNWEVRDLLKTAARQAAGYLARMQATEALLEARKFDAFNRMSAFVVHDLKNIVTQQSLMLKNAKRLGDNPEFRQDMLMTVENSLEKMKQLMLQLREGEKPTGVASGVDLAAVIEGIRQMAEGRGRALEVDLVDAVATRGHEQRLARVLGHVVQNALDATPPSGRVWLRLQQESGRAKVVVGDTGAGMTPEFVQNRLFRPFSSTKQSGMGIGSYESYQYVKELGGSIEVDSEPGRGTVVIILLPLFEARKGSDLLMTSSSQADAGPPQESLTPTGGGLGSAQPWGRS